ncbi:transcriptional regulator [Pseudomonas sp. 35 E 8]|uniref:transcriptional regulator n=1 Tax=Pseudomonas sp. 35 E 8 TaxID=1844103 RepID=UPI000811DF10|nr:transcriptional regulator [Pseudomonas sp. 35 E 8]CRM19243.1 anaerobic benzoate catabolism transcriptional regulator [Pseudomonas sp. 35 E 8]
MGFQPTLGQVLRELRVAAGLTREACAEVLSRPHLARVEQGQQAITAIKLHSLCELLEVPTSQVLLAVEARLQGVDLDDYKASWDIRADHLIGSGRLGSSPVGSAVRGVRGKRADETMEAVRKLQAEGHPKMLVVRQLGVSRSTVDKYWLKG